MHTMHPRIHSHRRGTFIAGHNAQLTFSTMRIYLIDIVAQIIFHAVHIIGTLGKFNSVASDFADRLVTLESPI